LEQIENGFFKASKISKKPGSAAKGLKYIQKLYLIENKLSAKDLNASVFLAKRGMQVDPILKKFSY